MSTPVAIDRAKEPDSAVGRQSASGTTFDVSISTLTEGERIEAAAGSDGEEVATILEGFFSVTVDDEFYRLTVGEGIIIPPGEPRIWVCESPRGVLYRALTR
jgi:quercetin dioxygenase-like cupin family protein